MKSKIEELEKQVAELSAQIAELKKQQPTYKDVMEEMKPRYCFFRDSGYPACSSVEAYEAYYSHSDAAARKNALQAKWENIAEYVNRRHEKEEKAFYFLSHNNMNGVIGVGKCDMMYDECTRFNSQAAALEALRIMGEDDYKRMIGVI